ncbi:uncharacterized protein LOC116156322 [Camelus dromedarius]|uniref:uncharacterized protein LOC116156322 n=1 Tax=Camelus dromedarius TaxID=9838 RepID=UPI00311A413E
MKWGAYLKQRAQYTTSPLAAKLQQVLGPMRFVAPDVQTLPQQGVDPVPSPFREGKGPPPETAWYTDGSCKGSPPTWVAVALHPATKAFWYETGEGQSSQWAELWAVWLVLINKPSPLQICTDSWAIYRGLTLWIPQWALQNWMIGHRPLWGQQMWKQLWDKGQKGQYTVYHVPGHRPALAPDNDAADALAQLRPVQAMVPGPDIGPWLHKKLGHIGSYTMRQVADRWGLHLSHSKAKDAMRHVHGVLSTTRTDSDGPNRWGRLHGKFSHCRSPISTTGHLSKDCQLLP